MHALRGFIRFLRSDPRHYQILALSTFLVAAFAKFRLDVIPLAVPMVLGIALLTQYAGTRLYRLPVFDARSALISSISLCLLLRSNSLTVLAIAAFITIAAKFTLRVNGKHIFNPTNLAIVLVLLTGQGWVSPGQWGGLIWFGLLVSGLGMLVVYRAVRYDTALIFFGTLTAIFILRALWLGDPWNIPWHQLKSSSLLIFTFFMITDPRTTPDHPLGRALFAVAVAVLTAYGKFGLFVHDAVFYALALVSLCVPIIDALLKANQYRWSQPALR